MTTTAATKAEKNLCQLLKLEQRARELQDKMYQIECSWNEKMNAVRDTPEWKDYCDRTGVCDRYNFGDVLA